MQNKMSGSLNHAMIDGPAGRAAQEYANQFGQPGFQDITRAYIDQNYAGYTEENQETWRTLYDRQMEYLADHASNVYLSGARNIKLVRDHIPYLSGPKSVNTFLMPLTGWQSKAVPGYLPAKAFFACLARLFWFTVEFGLIREGGRNRLYGSGLISSPGESKHALTSKDVDRRPFDLEAVCNTSFEIDHFQPILYVLDSFEQLRDAMDTYAKRLLDAARDNAHV